MPSQQELKWSRLRVGLTVLSAAITLSVLIILMGSSTGLFSHKITVSSNFNNAEGIRTGAAVRLEGVDVGNVTKISVQPGAPLPVHVVMRVTTKYTDAIRQDSTATLSTAGVLGETYVDISSLGKHGAPAQDGTVLPSTDVPGIQDVVKSTQTTLQNANVLLNQLGDILSTIQNGNGTIGKVIADPALYNNANNVVAKLSRLADQLQSGNGSIGKLLNDDALYNKLNTSVDRLDRLMAGVERGEGTLGKVVKDPDLYDHANSTIAKADALVTDINNGKGAIGMLAKDQAFANKLNATMDRVNSIADRLDRGEGSAGKILRDPALYDNANATMVSTRNLLEAIRKDPKRYLSIKLHIF